MPSNIPEEAAALPSRHSLVSILIMGLSFGLSLAQGDKAVLVGTVTDATDSLIPGADVLLRRLSTNDELTALTGESGDFALTGLVPDVYQLRVSMAGFRSELRTRLKLDVGRTHRLNVQLSIGEISETVEVAVSTIALDTETPELGQVIDSQKIVRVPLDLRDVIGVLGALTPGVQPTRTAYHRGRGMSFNVKGMRRSDNYAMLDGSQVSETNGDLQFFVNPDAVQEFEIKTGLYGAEYGVKAGGQFSLVSKSGTNQLHGTLFWFHRNDNLDARNFFDPGPRPEFKRNHFGAVGGGPVYLPGIFDGTDKAWWFLSYNGRRIRRFQSMRGNVPTAEEKSGNFLETIVDPLTEQPFPGHSIPQDRMDPIALKLLQFYPEPNTDPARGFNFTSSSPGSGDNDLNQVLVKLDFKTAEESRWSGRFLSDHRRTTLPHWIPTFTATNTLSSLTQNITNTRTIKGRFINEFGIHWYRRPYFAGNPPTGLDGFGHSLGLPNWPNKQIDVDGVPAVSVRGLLPIGSSSRFGPIPEGQWEVKNNLSWTQGSHLFKAGYHYRYHYVFFDFQDRSWFNFTPERYTGNALANFLLGYLTRSQEGSETRMNLGVPGHYFYFQDNWKVSPRLTLNLGLRYELRLAWKDKRGFSSSLRDECVAQSLSPVPDCFSPALVLPDPIFPATGRFAANEPLWNFAKTGWQPRLGLSFRLASGTVLRAGGGLYGNEPPGGMAYSSVSRNPRPNEERRTFLSDPAIPSLTLSDPFNPEIRVPGTGLPNVAGFQDPMPLWYVPNWGASIQHRITESSLLEVSYQGSRSVHEMQIIEFNDAEPGPGSRQDRRPFPALQSYQLLTGSGSQSYQGLGVRFEKKPGPEGLTALLAYTWAKSIDTTGGRVAVFGDPGSISRNVSLASQRGRGEGNIPGRLAVLAGYDLPFGQGRLAENKVLRQMLVGWTLYGIMTAQKGQWFTVADTDRLDVGSNASQRPQLVGNPNLPVQQRTPERWFNVDAFEAPPPFQYGNAGRGIVEGPGLFNVDLAILRNFQVSEDSRLEFRLEAFNLTNHPNFLVPWNLFSTGSLGAVVDVSESRSLQLGLKFYF